jgi:RES domain-containing protein
MILYRITLEKLASSLKASGLPARWNPKGRYVIYTAETRALACLENLVHRSGEGLHHLFCIVEIEVPDWASMQEIGPEMLPESWHDIRHYPVCQSIGDRWIEGQGSLLLRVPSSIIPDEHNRLINPAHPEFNDVRIRAVKPFRFDQRLK